jgi:hypothetical protein
MDTNQTVIEAHLAGTGKTIPLRQTKAKSGNLFWATLKQDKAGDRKFTSFGVNVPMDLTGDVTQIESIKVDGPGVVKVEHDITQPYFNPKTKKTSPGGKKRASAKKEFTSSDGQRWEFTFRATLVSEATATKPAIVNLQSTLHRCGGGGAGFGPQVQSSL